MPTLRIACLLAVVSLIPALGACDRPPEAKPPVTPKSALPVALVPDAVAQDDSKAAPPPKRAASPVRDATITARVKTALMADAQVKSLAISVDTKNAEVTLKGALDTDEQVAHAVDVARGVEGVQNVVNRLSVKGEDKANESGKG